MKILIIDDNRTITENIAIYLENRGFETVQAHNGEEAFDLIMRESFDFLIVDRMMPVIDGLSLIRMLRARSREIPFLFLTALSKQVDKIEGLSIGADDYLVKPFDLEELALRIENIQRRNVIPPPKSLRDKQKISIANISIDVPSKVVRRDDRIVDLAPKEYQLLELLAQNQGTILNRDYLYEKVWGEYEASDKTLETINVHIAHLRRKL